MESITNQLPDPDDVVGEVVKKVQVYCSEHKEFLAKVALALCAKASNKGVIVDLWLFFLEALLDNAGSALDTKSAATFTSVRFRAHGEKLRALVGDTDNRKTAKDIAGEARFERYLAGVYNIIDKASE